MTKSNCAFSRKAVVKMIVNPQLTDNELVICLLWQAAVYFSLRFERGDLEGKYDRTDFTRKPSLACVISSN